MGPKRTGTGSKLARQGLETAAAALLALLMSLSGSALAATGGAQTPIGGPPPPGSPTGTPAEGAPSAGKVTVVLARTWPRQTYYYGFRYPRLRFVIGSNQPQNDLQIDVVNSKGEVVKTYYRNDVAPNTTKRIRWDGTTESGQTAPNGRYHFQILPQGPAPLARRSAVEEPGVEFSFYRYAFPLLGDHDYGDAGNRFGAPRAGHTHQGQDVMAACGTPIVAARGGTVRYSGYEANAGNYLVIDGMGTPFDMVYMHLRERPLLKAGMTVRTGQPIGLVGRTGDATACHLHFEMWSAPGWYEGGSPFDPLPYLERWDRYS